MLPKKLDVWLALARKRDEASFWNALDDLWVAGPDAFYDRLLLALRTEGLYDAWLLAWVRGWELASRQEQLPDKRQSLLFGIRFSLTWSGRWTANEGRILSQALHAFGILPRSSRIVWFPPPQPLSILQALSPRQCWALHAAEPILPMPGWKQTPSGLPLPYLLLGRLDTPLYAEPQWPTPEALSTALGWPAGSIDAVNHLLPLLDSSSGHRAGTVVEDIAMDISTRIQHWCQSQGALSGSCRAFLEKNGNEATLSVQIKGQERVSLVTLTLGPNAPRWESLCAALQASFAQGKIPLLVSVSSSRDSP